VYSEGENLSQCHFVHNKFHTHRSRLNPRFRGERLVVYCLSRGGPYGNLLGRPETFGRPGQSNNFAPILTIFFKIYYLRESMLVFLKASVQIEDNSRVNSFA
jgi:hypothetical protein